MQEPVGVVAVFAGSRALSSILAAMLATMPGLKVRQFDSQVALTTYMRLAPVDLLVADFDCEASPADVLARALRSERRPGGGGLQIVALASKIDRRMQQVAIASGIDEVIVKPMSPKYLLERVQSRLRRTKDEFSARRALMPRADNVVPLFGPRHVPAG